jgi:hypothetical protein
MLVAENPSERSHERGRRHTDEALERLIRQLAPDAKEASAAGDTDALVIQFRLQAASHNFLLIILDNALDEEHVRSLIPREGKVLVVITSRKPRLTGLEIRDWIHPTEIAIDPLDHEESLTLFGKGTGTIRAGDRGAADEVASTAAGCLWPSG